MATSAAMGRGGNGEEHGLPLVWGVGQDESQPGRRARGSWRIENSAEDAEGPAFPHSSPCSSHEPQSSGHPLSYLGEMTTLFCGLDVGLEAPTQVNLLLSAQLILQAFPSPMPLGILIK